MPSWGGTGHPQRLRQLNQLVTQLEERLAVAEQVVEAVEQDTHFRLDAIEAAAA